MRNSLNINREALATGGLGNRHAITVLAMIVVWITATTSEEAGLIALVFALVYALLALRTIYLALEGNRILARKEWGYDLSPEEERELTKEEADQQSGISLYEVLYLRLGIFYLILAVMPLMRGYVRESYTFSTVLHILFIMFIIDLMTLTAVFTIAVLRRKYHEKRAAKS